MSDSQSEVMDKNSEEYKKRFWLYLTIMVGGGALLAIFLWGA